MNRLCLKGSCKAANNEECSVGTKIGHLEVKVANSRPILHLAKGKNFVYFPPVPENASRIEGKCINVSILIGTSQKKMAEYIRKRKGSELHERLAAGNKIADGSSLPLITDTENSYPGLAIVGVSKQNKFGMWRFKLSGESALRKMNFTSGRVLLLGPDDCIIFSAKDGEFCTFYGAGIRNIEMSNHDSRFCQFLINVLALCCFVFQTELVVS